MAIQIFKMRLVGNFINIFLRRTEVRVEIDNNYCMCLAFQLFISELTCTDSSNCDSKYFLKDHFCLLSTDLSLTTAHTIFLCGVKLFSNMGTTKYLLGLLGLHKEMRKRKFCTHTKIYLNYKKTLEYTYINLLCTKN